MTEPSSTTHAKVGQTDFKNDAVVAMQNGEDQSLLRKLEGSGRSDSRRIDLRLILELSKVHGRHALEFRSP